MRSTLTISSLFLFIFISQNILAQDSLKYGPDFYENKSGEYTELVMVYIGANNCGPCHAKPIKDKVEEYKIDLYKTAEEQGKSFSVIGVANDYSIEEGWNFINASGYFDEVIIGKNWKNNGSIQFLWSVKDILPSMPKVIVYERKIHQMPSKIVFGEPIVIANTDVGMMLNWNTETMSFTPPVKNNRN